MKTFNKKSRHLWLLLLATILVLNTFLVNVGYAYDSVQVLYKCTETGASTGNIHPNLQIANNGTTNLNLSDIKVRYWYTIDTVQPQTFVCDYAAAGTANVSGTFVTLGTPVTGADCYLELSFNQSAGIVGPSENSGDIQIRFYKNDNSNYTQTNDYSFNSTMSSAYTANPKITAYVKGVLVYGTDPVTGATAPPAPTSGPFSVNLDIDTSSERAAISPYIYGSNQNLTGTEGWTARRMGGNRMTGYNWENNASNAGSDYIHSSDNFVPSNEGVPANQSEVPGIAVTYFHDKAQQQNAKYTIATLQMAGYVSKDKNGTVSEAEKAPSARWVPVVPAKGSAFSLNPDLNDNAVYMDEFVNFMVNKYGNASTATGVKGYSLDNEPALWPSTHPRIHAAIPTCAELMSKSVALSKAVKNVDPYAEIFGPAAYGFAEYASFQDASDWSSLKGSYSWFLDYYLDQFKQASTTAGKRLLDVLDVHWYPEAQGGGSRITFGSFDPNNIACNKARIQAPRTLWDPTYLEKSWISQWCGSYLPLIPTLKKSIDTYYPGTKLAFTEFNYGGDIHISGGIAMTDALGIFGKYGVYLATYWQGDGNANYTSSAYKLYRNYDGAGSTYGDTKVKAETSDIENSSVYASIVGTDDSKLHVIVINKNYDNQATFNFRISGGKNYTSARMWAFDKNSNSITERTAVSSISGNSFSYNVPALTVCHFVLSAGTGSTPTPTPTGTATPTPTVTPSPTPTPTGTATPTSSPTPTPTPTGTATPTPTPTPTGTATPTPTNTPTPTPTPTGATSTPTPTPTPGTGGIKVQFFNGNTAATTNTLYPNFKLVNTGTSAVTLSDVKMRYYFTNDGTTSLSFACDWASAGNSNITSTFTTISATNADRYCEVGFTSGAGTLVAGANTEVKARIWKSDWSNFTQTNDYSFDATDTNYVDWAKVTGWLTDTLNWGTQP